MTLITKKFKYVLIPADICDPVQELEFEGPEHEFKNYLNLHFSSSKLLKDEKEKLSKDLADSVKKSPQAGELTNDLIENAVNVSQTCQIIPITLPTKSNRFDATNAYIDNVGRVKNLGQNSRATRVLQDDIRGDCFISRTFDDEITFKRTDFTLQDFQNYLANPPAKTSYDQSKIFEMINNPEKRVEELKPSEEVLPRCSGCLSVKDNLKVCGRCNQSYYCSLECQKEDWTYHKRICKPQSS